VAGFVIAKGDKPEVFVHGSDLTDNGRVSNPDFQKPAVDVTTFADAGHRNNLGLETVTYTYEGLYDSTLDKSYRTLTQDLRTNKRIVTVWPDGAGSANIGLAMGEAFSPGNNLPVSVGEAVGISASIVQDGTVDNVISLGTKHRITATENGGSYDRGAGQTTTSGARCFVHIFEPTVITGGNAQYDGTFASATTAAGAYTAHAVFSVGSGINTGTVLTVASGTTINRWVRYTFTRDATTGSVTFQPSFVAAED
jgi:hypothetical protein